MFVFRLLAFKFICLLIFNSRLLLNFMYFRFELFLYDLIFLAECVLSVWLPGCFSLCKLKKKSRAATWRDI